MDMLMSEPEASPVPTDARVEMLLHANEEQREREIADLIVTVAQPQARRVLSRFSKYDSLRPQDAEDILATVALRLIAKLRAASSSQDEGVRHFRDYVSRLTFNALNDHFRRRFPERARLKNRVRYVLTRDPRLALWTFQDELVCGLAQWSGTAPGEIPGSIDRLALERLREQPAAALVALFQETGMPLALHALVDLLAEAWHVVDLAPVQDPAMAIPPAETFEWLDYLTALWREMLQLRPMQRAALLLNLRDRETTHVLSLLVVTGVASFDDIAAALDMAPSDLEEIWNELPLDDLRIASMLDVTRQQVINLRKSARERLTRRLSHKRMPG